MDTKATIIPLNGKNYPTWKVQCRMALIKDGLWGIVKGTEVTPGEGNAEAQRKYLARRDCALALVVLAVEPTLLYLLGDPEDPQVVWTKLEEQFQRRTWANKLQLRRKLFSLKLKEGGSVNEHIKTMTKIFEELAVIGDPVSEEDRVVHLLASLPESYDVLVTALEAQSENVPMWELVTERLLHEETKLKGKAAHNHTDGRKALVACQNSRPKKPFTCHFCKRPGHFKRDCRKFLASQRKQQGAITAEAKSDEEGLLTIHALATTTSRGSWIVDSGATCHMSNNRDLFVELRELQIPQEVTLGDGRSLEGTAEGTVKLETLLPNGTTKKCRLENVLLVPNLSYSLLSVSKASSARKVTKFDSSGCEILNEEKKVIAFATRVGNLYHLEHCGKPQSMNVADKNSKERLWHRKYGHLGEQNLQKIARKQPVKGFNYDASKRIGFCETCISGKHQCTPFASGTTQSTEVLELVHSDVCGKMQEKSLGGGEYFLTFTEINPGTHGFTS